MPGRARKGAAHRPLGLLLLRQKAPPHTWSVDARIHLSRGTGVAKSAGRSVGAAALQDPPKSRDRCRQVRGKGDGSRGMKRSTKCAVTIHHGRSRRQDAAALISLATDLATPVPRLRWILACRGSHRPSPGYGDTGPATLVDPGMPRLPPTIPRTWRHWSRDLGGSRRAAAPVFLATDLATPVPRLRWILACRGSRLPCHGPGDTGPTT